MSPTSFKAQRDTQQKVIIVLNYLSHTMGMVHKNLIIETYFQYFGKNVDYDTLSRLLRRLGYEGLISRAPQRSVAMYAPMKFLNSCELNPIEQWERLNGMQCQAVLE